MWEARLGWLWATLYHVVTDVAVTTLLFAVLVLLPLACFRSKRSFAGLKLVYASYVFEVNQWMFSMGLLWIIWGWVGVFFGLGLTYQGLPSVVRQQLSLTRHLGRVASISVLALAALLIHRRWAYASELVLMGGVTYASFIGGLKLLKLVHFQQNQPAPNS